MKGLPKQKFSDILLALLALCAGAVIVFPVLYGILGSFKTEAEFSSPPPSLFPRSFTETQNFRDVWRQIPVPRYFLNSLITAGLAAGVRVLLAVLAAYALVFFNFRGKSFFFFLILGTMMLPADTLVITNYQTVARLGLLDTYLGMAVTSFVGASQMFMLRQSFLSTPKELREAGELDGCGDMRFLWSVLLPMTGGVTGTLFVQSFINVWNAYLWPLLVTNRTEMRTMQVGVTMLTTYENANYTHVLAGACLSLIPAFLLFIPLRRRLSVSLTAGALVG